MGPADLPDSGTRPHPTAAIATAALTAALATTTMITATLATTSLVMTTVTYMLHDCYIGYITVTHRKSLQLEISGEMKFHEIS